MELAILVLLVWKHQVSSNSIGNTKGGHQVKTQVQGL